MELTSKQRAQLRGLANSIDTILHVGKDGIGDVVRADSRDIKGVGGVAVLKAEARADGLE